MTTTTAPRGTAAPAADERSESRAAWLAGHESFTGELPSGEPEALAALRRRGIERFAVLGFPTLRQEEWRFTDVSRVERGSFLRPGTAPPDVSLDEAALAPFVYPETDRLVFVDGHLAEDLCRVGDLPEGAFAGGLRRALGESGLARDALLAHLGAHARIDEHPFAALSTGFVWDGAFVFLPPRAVLSRPLHLLYVSTGAASEDSDVPASFPRLLVVAEEASQGIVLENYVSLGEGEHFSAPVGEIVAAQGAVLDHYKVQQEGRASRNLGFFHIHLERSANVRSHTVTTGGALTRNDTHVILSGEGGECTLNGLYVVNGTQQVDNHMRVEHAAPHCDSYELFKGILDERARAVFNGRIYVHPGAQKTDAKQSNRNLLLSKDALVNSNPQLEIFADDVKCTHGSTVGQLDPEAVFYLRSRGIGREAAESLLTYAFASDIVERIKVAPVRDELREFLFHRLPKGEVVRQAV